MIKQRIIYAKDLNLLSYLLISVLFSGNSYNLQAFAKINKTKNVNNKTRI